MFPRALVPLLFLAVLLATPAHPQSGRTILVLDGSGSMWGRIDDLPKITIAQQVIGEMLDTMPEGTELGLSLYGHRRDGDCEDIELAVPAGPDTRDTIRDAVNAVSPRGKTPLSAAVAEAAKSLDYKEQAATVILISDGRETCELDPCEVGAQLESDGANFTTHVIGFDIASAEDRAQLQCLAEATGGTFLTAANADELTSALGTINAEAPAPAPVFDPDAPPVDVYFFATDGEDGPTERDGLVWTLADVARGAPIFADFDAPELRMALPPGRYRADVRRIEDGVTATAEVDVTADSLAEFAMVLPIPLPDATVEGPTTAPAGATITVAWTGPEFDYDYVSIAAPGTPGARQVAFAAVSDGATLQLRAPAQPGAYELRYVMSEGREILARAPLEVTPVEASVAAPETAVAGATLAIDWTGPAYDDDRLTITTPDSPSARQITHASPSGDGAPELRAPAAPGTYELRYVMGMGRTVLASQTIEVTAAEATLDAPVEALVGANVDVAWIGPGYAQDTIAIVASGAPIDEPLISVATESGAPAELTLPQDPGTYDLVYVMDLGSTELARREITLVEPVATLEVAEEGVVGSSVEVSWTGPGEPGDLIVIAAAEDGAPIAQVDLSEDATVALPMPAEPGDYEIRYVMARGNAVLATAPVTVADVTATLSGPETANVSETITVEWTGPNYEGDAIVLAQADAEDGDVIATAPTSEGASITLELPDEGGAYEVLYVMGLGDRILARQPLEINANLATISFPEQAIVAAEVEVTWTGPEEENDFVAVTWADATPVQQINFALTADGNPVKLTMPPEPGEYVVRYVLSTDGGSVLAEAPIQVLDAVVELIAPVAAEVRSTITVDWAGPGYESDHVVLAPASAPIDNQIGFQYTREGSSLKFTMPEEPGLYEIRYILDEGQRILASAPIEVTPLSARIAASAEAVAGATVEVSWSGPGELKDFVAIARPEDEAKTQISTALVSDGATISLTAPPEPGVYELRYILAESDQILATRAITVTEVDAQVLGPSAAPAGSTMIVQWSGPAYGGDYIAISEAESDDAKPAKVVYAESGSPVMVELPGAPGEYELQYVMGTGDRVIARAPLQVTEDGATWRPAAAERGAETDASAAEAD